MNKLYRYMVVTVALFSLLGCGSSGKDDEVVEIVEPVEDRVLESNVLGVSELDPLVLEGTWVSECLVVGEDSSKNQWTYKNNSVEMMRYDFTGVDCKENFSRTKLKGHFELGEVLNLDSAQQVNKIRYLLDSITVIYYSDDVVSQFNSIELCELNDWQIGVYLEVTDCDAFKSVSYMGNDIFLTNGESLAIGDLSNIGLNSFPLELAASEYVFREPEVIEGDWMQECNTEIGNNSMAESIVFSGTLYTRQSDIYWTSSCDEAVYAIRESGSIVVGNEQILNSGITATEIDFSINSIKLAFYSVEFSELYSREELCGINDWSVGEYREVSGCQFFPIEEPIKNIYYIEEEKLFFGLGASPRESSYPTELSESFYIR